MKCLYCGDSLEGRTHGVVVLEDGIVHSECAKDRQANALAEEFPKADKFFIRDLNEVYHGRFRDNKYCLEVHEVDLDDRSCSGNYVSLEFFDTEREVTDFIRSEIFDNNQYSHKWVDDFHVNQEKTKFEFSIFFGGVQNTEAFMDLQDQLDSEKSYLTSMKENNNYFKDEVDINNLIWALDTPKVQELLDEIKNSHHFRHLEF